MPLLQIFPRLIFLKRTYRLRRSRSLDTLSRTTSKSCITFQVVWWYLLIRSFVKKANNVYCNLANVSVQVWFTDQSMEIKMLTSENIIMAGMSYMPMGTLIWVLPSDNFNGLTLKSFACSLLTISLLELTVLPKLISVAFEQPLHKKGRNEWITLNIRQPDGNFHVLISRMCIVIVEKLNNIRKADNNIMLE